MPINRPIRCSDGTAPTLRSGLVRVSCLLAGVLCPTAQGGILAQNPVDAVQTAATIGVSAQVASSEMLNVSVQAAAVADSVAGEAERVTQGGTGESLTMDLARGVARLMTSWIEPEPIAAGKPRSDPLRPRLQISLVYSAN